MDEDDRDEIYNWFRQRYEKAESAFNNSGRTDEVSNIRAATYRTVLDDLASMFGCMDPMKRKAIRFNQKEPA